GQGACEHYPGQTGGVRPHPGGPVRRAAWAGGRRELATPYFSRVCKPLGRPLRSRVFRPIVASDLPRPPAGRPGRPGELAAIAFAEAKSRAGEAVSLPIASG